MFGNKQLKRELERCQYERDLYRIAWVAYHRTAANMQMDGSITLEQWNELEARQYELNRKLLEDTRLGTY